MDAEKLFYRDSQPDEREAVDVTNLQLDFVDEKEFSDTLGRNFGLFGLGNIPHYLEEWKIKF